MAGWRQALELALSDEEIAALTTISRSRTEPASRVERARMLLSYRENSSFFAVGRTVGVHHQTVQRCVERAVAHGPMAALDDLPRPGKQPTITAEAKAWVVNLACRKAKELGYPHELWTTRLLARHVREHAPAAGHICLAELAQGTLCNILNEQEIKPHKVRYYLERRDPQFKQKMAEVLCVYREVKLIEVAIYPFRFFAAEGGLMSYGPDQIDQWRGAATYVDRILKGEKPGDLPVQAPTKYELVINMRTAKALGFNIPPALPLRADDVIE